MTQRYKDQRSLMNMATGTCPECGEVPEAHSGETRFWVRPGWPNGCDLTPRGVHERIAQYKLDLGIAPMRQELPS